MIVNHMATLWYYNVLAMCMAWPGSTMLSVISQPNNKTAHGTWRRIICHGPVTRIIRLEPRISLLLVIWEWLLVVTRIIRLEPSISLLLVICTILRACVPDYEHVYQITSICTRLRACVPDYERVYTLTWQILMRQLFQVWSNLVVVILILQSRISDLNASYIVG